MGLTNSTNPATYASKFLNGSSISQFVRAATSATPTSSQSTTNAGKLVSSVASVNTNINTTTNVESLVKAKGTETLGSAGVPISTVNPLLSAVSGNLQSLDILATKGTKTEEQTEFRFKIAFQFDGENRNYWDDVTEYQIFRFAFLKSAGSSILTLNLTPIVYQQVHNDISSQKYPSGTLYIYTIENIKKPEEKKNLLNQHKFIVYRITARGDADLSKTSRVVVSMVLYDPILFEMSRKLSFNKTFKVQDPYSILGSYESYVDSTYGSGAFETKHVMSNKNDYKYEQILIQPSPQDIKLPNNHQYRILAKSDISIPLFLQYKYKIDNSFGFYFFDHFNFKSKKAIVRYFITFYDKNKFEKFDVSKYQSILKNTNGIRAYNFDDYDKLIVKDEDAVTNFKLTNSQYATKKTQKSESPVVKASAEEKIQLSKDDSNRFYYGVKSETLKKSQSQSSDSTTLQAPDTQDAAQKRVNIGKETITKKIDKIEEMFTTNTFPDWLQFGYIYNLSNVDSSSYIYSPISIVGCFHRISEKETQLAYYTKYLMIKFMNDKSSESSTTGVNTDGKSETAASKAAGVDNSNKAKKDTTTTTKSNNPNYEIKTTGVVVNSPDFSKNLVSSKIDVKIDQQQTTAMEDLLKAKITLSTDGKPLQQYKTAVNNNPYLLQY